MKKYNQARHSPLHALQQKLDARFGKGLINALAVLLLGACLSLNACVPDGKEQSGQQGTAAQQGANGDSGQPTERTTPRTPEPRIVPPTAITITDTGQKSSPANRPSGGDFPAGPCVLDAYFARKNEAQGAFEQIKTAGLEDEVYLVVDTMDLAGKEVEVSILDRDKIIADKAYGALSFQQEGKDVSGKFRGTVRTDGYAVIGLTLKPGTDDKEGKTLKGWREKIGAVAGKRLKLCVKVTVKAEHVIYCGQNPPDHKEGKAEANFWLDMDGKWFEVRRKNPVIVLDPGHGIKGHKSNEGAQARIYKYRIKGNDGKVKLDDKKGEMTLMADIMDLPQYAVDNPEEWLVGDNSLSNKNHKFDNERTEYQLTYDICKIMYDKLKSKDYKVFITRTTRDVVDLNENDLVYRVRMANEAKADYLVSIHADGVDGFTSGAHAIYSSVTNIKEGQELGEDIMRHYTVSGVENNSPKIDVRGLHLFKEINKALRTTLVEVGFVTSPKDAKQIFSNQRVISMQLFEGLIDNIEKNY